MGEISLYQLVIVSNIFAFLLDLALGDPLNRWHPAAIIGRYIAWLEKKLRHRHRKSTKGGSLRAGKTLVIIVILTVAVITGALCAGAYLLHPMAFFVINTFLGWQILSVKGLKDAGMKVCSCLIPREDLGRAREAVGEIVGRDTSELDKSAVIRATIETVAENGNDGAVAPLFYMFIGGAPLGMVYKAINTMDSMIGYKNKKYLYFGRAAAKTDDAAGFIPARLAAICWIIGAFLNGCDTKNAFRIWKRDRLNHTSPNAGQTESACAGALHVRLGGPSTYFGKVVEKPYIGDPDRDVTPDDIPMTCKILYTASSLAIGGFMVIAFLIVW